MMHRARSGKSRRWHTGWHAAPRPGHSPASMPGSLDSTGCRSTSSRTSSRRSRSSHKRNGTRLTRSIRATWLEGRSRRRCVVLRSAFSVRRSRPRSAFASRSADDEQRVERDGRERRSRTARRSASSVRAARSAFDSETSASARGIASPFRARVVRLRPSSRRRRARIVRRDRRWRWCSDTPRRAGRSQSRSASRPARSARREYSSDFTRGGRYGFSTGAPTRLPHSVHDPS